MQKKPACSVPTTKTSLSSQSEFLTHADLLANQRFEGATRASSINGLGQLLQANGMDPTASANQKVASRLNQVKKNGLLQSPLYQRKDWKEDGQWGKCKRYKFIFPLHKLKGELSKRESQYGKIELYKKQIQEKKKASLSLWQNVQKLYKEIGRTGASSFFYGKPPGKRIGDALGK